MQFICQQSSEDEYRLWLKIFEQEKKTDPADEAFFDSAKVARLLFDKRLSNGYDVIVSWTYDSHDGKSAQERIIDAMAMLFKHGAEEIVNGPDAVNFFVGFTPSFND